MTLTVTEAGLSLADPAAYTDEDRLHQALTLLRRQAPVHRVEADGYDPFWAVTRHADIMEIERNNALFINAPRPLLATAEMEAMATAARGRGHRPAHAHPHGRPAAPGGAGHRRRLVPAASDAGA